VFAVLAICEIFGTEIGLTDKEKDVSANDWSSVIDDTQMSIVLNPATNQITTNQNPEFVVRIKNLSTNEVFHLYIGDAFLLSPGISFIILSPSGKDVSPIFDRHPMKESGGMVWIPPGKVDGFIVDLRQFCKMDELGTYKITMTIQRGSSDRHKFYNVVSNPLYVTVVPAQKP
jgi:hypothetical protein